MSSKDYKTFDLYDIFTPDELDHIKELDIPVVCRTGDPHWAKRYNQFEFHEKLKGQEEKKAMENNNL